MFTTDPVLTELWIVAMCCIVNGTDAFPVHADVAEQVARWRARDRPRA